MSLGMMMLLVQQRQQNSKGSTRKSRAILNQPALHSMRSNESLQIKFRLLLYSWANSWRRDERKSDKKRGWKIWKTRKMSWNKLTIFFYSYFYFLFNPLDPPTAGNNFQLVALSANPSAWLYSSESNYFEKNVSKVIITRIVSHYKNFGFDEAYLQPIMIPSWPWRITDEGERISVNVVKIALLIQVLYKKPWMSFSVCFHSLRLNLRLKCEAVEQCVPGWPTHESTFARVH